MAHKWDTCPKCEGTGMGWELLYLPTWDELFDSQSHCTCFCHAGHITCQTCEKVVPMWEQFKQEQTRARLDRT